MSTISALQGKNLVHNASKYAKKYLSSIKRRTGESYVVHGKEVSNVLREFTDDPHLLAVAILHDIQVHPDGDTLLKKSPLSQEDQELAITMHALRRMHIDENTQDLDTVIQSFTEQKNMIHLRMAHRLNDIRHIGRFPKKLQREIAHETLHMYTAIAGRLSLNTWRHEMEDICFALLHPNLSKQLEKKFLQKRTIDKACLTQTRAFLASALKKKKIRAEFHERKKGIYSTYRKMILKEKEFDELTDRLALRIIVQNTEDCYRTLGVVHALMHPIPGKLKDYIGAPKENGYQSIHTVVYPLPGVTEQPMEIQIRSEAMHRTCEYGDAAHALYKESLYILNTKPARVNLYRNLKSLRWEARSPQQFEQALREYFREDHLAIFDEKNNLYHLPKPATGLDFACHAYGHRTTFLKDIKINGRMRNVDTLLTDGDTVEVLFSRKKTIDTTWTRSCKSEISRKKIQSWLSKD